jgi:thiopurine S-methyltransferase
MQADFWHDRWTRGQIGFHEPEAHPLLVAHVNALALPDRGRVFLPLCGMTLDIDWLLSRGYRVAGAELSSLAVAQLFRRLGVEPRIARVGALECHSGPGIDVFVGDVFALTRSDLGPVDGVYDRAALIALPAPLRERYVPHIVGVTAGRPELVIGLDYDQECMDGPPFAVGAAEVRRLFTQTLRPEPRHLATRDVPGGLKGRCPAVEQVWLVP